MMATLLRNAKIPNGRFEPATTRLIIEMVESLVAKGTQSGRSHTSVPITIVAIQEPSLIMCQSNKLSAEFNTFNMPHMAIYERMDHPNTILKAPE